MHVTRVDAAAATEADVADVDESEHITSEAKVGLVVWCVHISVLVVAEWSGLFVQANVVCDWA